MDRRTQNENSKEISKLVLTMSYTNYTQISNEIILNEEIPPLAKVVFSVLNSFAQRNKNRMCKISLTKLSKLSNIGIKTVRKLRDILIELGFIEIIKPDRGRCHSYRVNFTSTLSTTTPLSMIKASSTTQPCSDVPPININTEENIENDFLKEQERWNSLQLRA